jgi:imidazolonepropionase-like amidohydrolase
VLKPAAFLAALPLLAIPAGPGASPNRPPAGPPVAFVDVTVIPMDRERRLEHQTVVVVDGRIAVIGPVRNVSIPSRAVRVDGRGRFLMPGLADMHAHLLPGLGDDSSLAGQQMTLLLANGVTTARALGGARTGLAFRARLRSGEVAGPSLWLAGPSLNGNSVKDVAAARRLVEEQKAAGFDLLKTHGGFGPEIYDTLVATAKRLGMPLSGHVTPEYGLYRALAAGQQIEHLDGYIAALMTGPDSASAPGDQIVVDPAVLAKVREAKIPGVVQATKDAGVWHGPTLALFSRIVGDSTAEQLGAGPEMKYVPPAMRTGMQNQWKQIAAEAGAPAESRAAFVALRNRLVKAMHAAGVRLLVGSDSPQFFLVPGFAVHDEIEAFVAAGLTPYAALEAATRNPAEWLGAADSMGTVARGKRADLLLLEADPLVDARNARRIGGVMVGGRWMDAGEIATRLAALAERNR